MSPLRALVSLAILRAANAIVPPRDPETRIDRARFQVGLALLDLALRLDDRGSLAEYLADLTEPPPCTCTCTGVVVDTCDDCDERHCPTCEPCNARGGAA